MIVLLSLKYLDIYICYKQYWIFIYVFIFCVRLFLAWHIRRVKLGVALAVIKSKPAGRSSRQHAEYLASKLKQQEENWKSKAEELKEEVLSLKQELLVTKLLRKQRNGAEAVTARGE